MDCVVKLDPDRLEKYLDDKKVEACGGGPIVAVMRAAIAAGANRAKLLRHSDSGDLTGDKSSVVGYVAAVLYRADQSRRQRPALGGGLESDTAPPPTH